MGVNIRPGQVWQKFTAINNHTKIIIRAVDGDHIRYVSERVSPYFRGKRANGTTETLTQNAATLAHILSAGGWDLIEESKDYTFQEVEDFWK